jgi:tetratricopeptide (TPR) repeat protein
VKGEIAEILDTMKGLVADLQAQVSSFDEGPSSSDRSDRFGVFLHSVARLRSLQEDLSMACRKFTERNSENATHPLKQSPPAAREQPLEEMVGGFTKGEALTLSEVDYETHYNLGIAYREIGLLNEAIGELQLAAQATKHPVDCYSLLGSCFVEKGFQLAIEWYERGLEAQRATEVRDPRSPLRTERSLRHRG